MKDPKLIKITIQHAPIGDGKDWVMDVWMHECERVEHHSWNSQSLEDMIQSLPDCLKRYIAHEPESLAAHHD